MRWSAFMMARNEEVRIADTISRIRNQTIPPKRIHVLNDGSIDSTGTIIDELEGVIATHNPPHPSELSTQRYTDRRNSLMHQAKVGMDYILIVDADTEIPPDYIERITKQMQSDNVVVARGIDERKSINPGSPGLVINVKWLDTHKPLPSYPLTWLAGLSVMDGHPTIVYTNIRIHHNRAFGTHYTPKVWTYRGAQQRKGGMALHWALLKSIRLPKTFFLGYVTYRGERAPKVYGRFINDFEKALFLRGRGFKSPMFQETEVGVFILPSENYKNRRNSVNPDVF